MVLTIKQLEQIGINALNKAHQVNEKLGAKGLEVVRKNRFGETALKADIEMEKAVISALRKANLPIKIISEEHGTINITDNPVYLGMLDGLDGSEAYGKRGGKERCGTMFGVFSNLNPTYEDYIFSGIMEHPTKRLFFASKNRGSFVIHNEKTTTIHCSKTSKLDKRTRIYVDEYFDINKKTFSAKLQHFDIRLSGSSAVYAVDLASGNADLVLWCTYKNNLELASSYGLVNEAGGVVVTSDGISLKHKKYLQFGQDKHIAIITASTRQLAEELIEHIGRS